MAKTKTPDTEIAVEAATATVSDASVAAQTADVTDDAAASQSPDAEAVAAEAPAADATAAHGHGQVAEAMPKDAGDAARAGTVSADDTGAPTQHLSRDEVEAFGLDPFVYGYGTSAS